MSGQVYFEEKNKVMYVYINNLPANKISVQFLKELYEGLNERINELKVQGIIIAGKGRHFSCGTDIDNLKKIIVEEVKIGTDGQITQKPLIGEYCSILNKLYELEIPVISSISGVCIGSGMEIALHSHIRIASNNAVLGSPESTFGLIPGLGGILRSLEIMGISNTLEWVLKGETFSAEEAFNRRMVDYVVNKKENMKYCEGLMEYIINQSSKYCKDNIKEYIDKFNKNYWGE